MTNAWFDDTVTPTTDYGVENMPRSVVVPTITGRRRTRVMYPKAPTFITARIVCNEGQAALFEAWYQSESGAGNGSLPFEFPSRLPTGHSKRAGFIRDGFSGPETLSGGKSWAYGFTIELIDQPSFTGDWFEYWPEGVRYAAIFDQAVNLKWPEE